MDRAKRLRVCVIAFCFASGSLAACDRALSDEAGDDPNQELPTQAYGVGLWVDCIDPDLNRLPTSVSVMLCSGESATGKLNLEDLTPDKIVAGKVIGGVIGTLALPAPACTTEGQTECLTTGIFKSGEAAVIIPENIRTSVMIASVSGTFDGTSPNCTTNGEIACVTTASYRAADITHIIPENIKSGIMIAGVTGAYPSASVRLDGATAMADLTSFDAATPAGAYEFFDSTGMRYSGSIADAATIVPSASSQNFNAALYRGFAVAGDPALTAVNIKSGVAIFGVSGLLTPAPASCTGNGETACVTTVAYKAADLTNLSVGNVKAGVTIASVNGAYPSATHRLSGADGTTDLPALASTSGGTTYEWFQADGTRLTGTVEVDVTASASASDQTFNAGVYRSVSVTGDAALLATNIRSGTEIFAVTGSVTGAPLLCSANGAVGCVTSATYRAADLTNLSAANVKNGIIIAGVTGAYPSATYPLSTDTVTADLASMDSTTPAGAYEFFDSTGTRYTGTISDAGTVSPTTSDQAFAASLYRGFTVAGSAGLSAGNIKSGVTLFGVAGSMTPSPATCSSNTETGCVTTSTYQAADLSALTAGNIKAGVTIAGMLGAYPSATHLLAGTTAATPLPAFAATTGGSSYEWFQADGTKFNDTITANETVTPGAANQVFNTGLYRSVTVDGDADLIAGHIKDGVAIFGVSGSVTPSPDPCDTDGEESCLATTAFRAAEMSDVIAGNIKSGVTIAGVAGNITGAPANCAANGAVGCVTTATYKAADLTNLSAGNIKNGVTIAGIAGTYPSLGTPLASNTVATDLTSLAATTAAGSYEFFDSTGAAYTGSISDAGTVTPTSTNQTFNASAYRSFTVAGDTDLAAANIRASTGIFAVTGTVTPTPADCASDGDTACVTTATYKAADTGAFVAGDLKTGKTVAGVAGALANCAADGAGSCLVDGTNYKAAVLANFAAADVKTGVTVAGVAGSATMETHTPCTSDGATGCVTSASYPAASAATAVAGNIKSGVTIANVAGQYPSATYPLNGAGGTADLENATFTTQIKSATAFEYWDSAGTRYTGNGDSNIVAAKIRNAQAIFGTTGNATIETHTACASDGASGCYTDGTNYKAARLSNFAASDVKTGVQIASVTGTSALEAHTPCATDGGTGCVTTASYLAVNAATAVAGNIKSGVTIANIAGQYPSATYPLPGAVGGTADLASGTFATQIKSATGFEYWDSAGTRYTGAGDANIVAGKILTGNAIFGTAGSVIAETHGACATDGATGCVPDGTTYKAARLANFTAADVESGVTVAGVAGSATIESHSACASDGAGSCVVNGTTYKAASTATAIAANIKTGVTIAGAAGGFPSSTNKLTGADSTTDLVSGTAFNTAMKSASAFEWYDSAGTRYTNNGDADIKAGLIATGVDIFGAVGTFGISSLSASNLTATLSVPKVVTGWSRTGTGVIIVRRASASVTWEPTNGTSYSVGSPDGTHTIVYVGTALTYDDTSVSSGTTYYYKAFAYNADYGYSIASNEASVTYSAAVCGGAGDGCYDDSGAMTAGVATTPLGKSIEYVISSGSFKVWKEVSGNRVLRPNGTDAWAKNLNLSGKGLSATDFTVYTNIAGRVCPPNVYIDDSNKQTTTNCLYYSNGFASQTLNTAGTSQTTSTQIGLGNWSTELWYIGNIRTCSDLGMRLPTIFETNTTTTSNGDYPYWSNMDGARTFASSNGVPPHASGSTWTATPNVSSFSNYFGWTAAASTANYTVSRYVRCVLP